MLWITSFSEAASVSRTSGEADFIDRFARVPGEVRRDPYRVGLLPESAWRGFLSQPTPFAREFWLVREAGGDDARAINRIGASLSAVHAGAGAIGFFELDVEHPRAEEDGRKLLETACGWLKARGASVAHGPMNYNTWFPYRFRLESLENCEHEDPSSGLQFAWEPVNPPRYVEIFLKSGFSHLEDYHSQGHAGLDAFAAATRPAYERALTKGYSFRPFDASRAMDVDVPALYEISMAGFKDNFLFEPIPFEAFRGLYVPIVTKMDLSLSHMALDERGKAVAFFFCFEDQGYVVYKSVAVAPSARGQGLSNAVAYLAAEAGLKRGLTKMITALVKIGAQSESYAKKVRLLWEHRYVLLTKALE